MEINERHLKFKGSAITLEPIDREKYVIIAGEFEPGNITHKPNEDGTYDEITELKPLRLMVTKEGDERMKLKVKSKNSVRLRGALWHKAQELGKLDEFDDWYDYCVDKIIVNLDEVLKLIT